MQNYNIGYGNFQSPLQRMMDIDQQALQRETQKKDLILKDLAIEEAPEVIEERRLKNQATRTELEQQARMDKIMAEELQKEQTQRLSDSANMSANDLDMQEALKNQQKSNAAFAAGNYKLGKELSQLASEQSGRSSENKKRILEDKIKQLEIVRDTLQGVKDQSSLSYAKQALEDAGLHDASKKIPIIWTPEVQQMVEQNARASITMKDRIELDRKEQEYQLRVTEENNQETSRRNQENAKKVDQDIEREKITSRETTAKLEKQLEKAKAVKPATGPQIDQAATFISEQLNVAVKEDNKWTHDSFKLLSQRMANDAVKMTIEEAEQGTSFDEALERLYQEALKGKYGKITEGKAASDWFLGSPSTWKNIFSSNEPPSFEPTKVGAQTQSTPEPTKQVVKDIPAASKAAWGAYEPEKYDYKVGANGKLYRAEK